MDAYKNKHYRRRHFEYLCPNICLGIDCTDGGAPMQPSDFDYSQLSKMIWILVIKMQVMAICTNPSNECARGSCGLCGCSYEQKKRQNTELKNNIIWELFVQL